MERDEVLVRIKLPFNSCIRELMLEVKKRVHPTYWRLNSRGQPYWEGSALCCPLKMKLLDETLWIEIMAVKVKGFALVML